MRARCRRMAEPTRDPLPHPTVVVWVAGRRLTAAVDLMVDSEVAVHLLTAQVDRRAGSEGVDMPLADSAVVGTLRAVEDITAEAAEGTAAVATVAVTKTKLLASTHAAPSDGVLVCNGNELTDACIKSAMPNFPSFASSG